MWICQIKINYFNYNILYIQSSLGKDVQYTFTLNDV